MTSQSPSPPLSPNSKVLGVILAGGRSRRMGTDKAQVILDGRTLLDWVCRAVCQVVTDVVVVGRDQARGLTAIPDAVAGSRGPSAGIATGLRAGGGRPIVVVGVDQPWVQPSTLASLLQIRPRPTTPLDGPLQVTCATYPARSLKRLEEAARRGSSLQKVVPQLGGSSVPAAQWRSWGEDGRSWFSVDTVDDLSEGIRRYGSPCRTS